MTANIVFLNKYSPSQARNAYSAMLLVPGYDGLRFCPLLHPFKRQWNTSVPKYASFWDATPLIQRLAGLTLSPEASIKEVRDRLILVCKLLWLHRSVDLSRVLRSVSLVGGQPFIKIRRKGHNSFRWERMVHIPDFPDLSPWSLMVRYVAMTASQGTPGGPLLLSLSRPWTPLSSNSVAPLTKEMLSSFGIPVQFWGAHSTRAAGVSFYKGLGLSSEQVCDRGKWKNAEAFTAHYLRLGAAGDAKK